MEVARIAAVQMQPWAKKKTSEKEEWITEGTRELRRKKDTPSDQPEARKEAWKKYMCALRRDRRRREDSGVSKALANTNTWRDVFEKKRGGA